MHDVKPKRVAERNIMLEMPLSWYDPSSDHQGHSYSRVTEATEMKQKLKSISISVELLSSSAFTYKRYQKL